MAQIGTNPIFAGKALAAGTQVLVVLVAAQLLDPAQTNTLFSLLALSTIVAAVSSFGANGALVPFLYRNADRAASLLTLLLAGKLLIAVAGALVLWTFGLNRDLPPLLIAWTAFTISLLFVDFVAESCGDA